MRNLQTIYYFFCLVFDSVNNILQVTNSNLTFLASLQTALIDRCQIFQIRIRQRRATRRWHVRY